MKETSLKIGCFIGFLHPTEENLPIQKVTSMNRFVNKYKNVLTTNAEFNGESFKAYRMLIFYLELEIFIVT